MEPTHSPTTRRDFLKQTTAVAAGLSLAATGVRGEVGGRERADEGGAKPRAAEKVVIGLIGPGGQGTSLLRAFGRQDDIELAYVCDVDGHRLSDAVNAAKDATGKEPKAVRDLREVLDDKAVDAVVIATPDHWHAPATILACEAGKHVYVEKPASHNVREGRLMIEAARRNRRVVQVGTQSRSAEHAIEAMKRLKDGIIGDVLVAKAWNSQRRADIGRRQPTEPPTWLNYDLWLGPAPAVPYQPNRLHGVWRWWYDFGTGDIGNDGIHDLDLARWGLGVETYPNAVAAMGGKYFFKDDQQFPDTYYVSYRYDLGDGSHKQLIYEQRTWSPYVQEGHENGNAFYGTKGMMVLGKHSGWQVFGPRNEPGEKMEGGIDLAAHCRDFLDHIKGTGAGDADGSTPPRPRADIETGHLSSCLSHLGNIATRVGRVIQFDPKTEQVTGDDEANRLTRREYREGHWAVPKGV